MSQYLSLLLVFGILNSCSNVNTPSREHYVDNKKMRHGVVPIEISEKEKKKVSAAANLPVSKKAIARGKKIFQKSCVSCHGQDASGNGPMAKNYHPRPANLKKVFKDIPNFRFYLSVSKWVGEMPGWESPLSDKEVADLSQYLRSIAN